MEGPAGGRERARERSPSGTRPRRLRPRAGCATGPDRRWRPAAASPGLGTAPCRVSGQLTRAAGASAPLSRARVGGNRPSPPHPRPDCKAGSGLRHCPAGRVLCAPGPLGPGCGAKEPHAPLCSGHRGKRDVRPPGFAGGERDSSPRALEVREPLGVKGGSPRLSTLSLGALSNPTFFCPEGGRQGERSCPGRVPRDW